MTLFDPEPFQHGTGSAGSTRTVRQRNLIAAGYHPLTRRPLLDPGWGFTCGGCLHLATWSPNRTYWKCGLVATHGPATDLRVSWPACQLYTESTDRSLHAR